MGKPHVHRIWMSQSPEAMDDIAEYYQRDYECAMEQIRALVDRVERGDVLHSLNEGFFIPKDYSLVDLWRNDDGYHAMFPKRSGPARKNWGKTGDMKREANDNS